MFCGDEVGFGAGLLGGRRCRELGLEGLLCRGGRVDRGLAAIHDVLQSLDFATGDDVRIAPVQLLLRLQLLECLLVSRLGLLDLGVSGLDIRPGD